MGFIQSLLAGVLTDLLKDFASYLASWFGRKRRIDKATKRIQAEQDEVMLATKDILETKERGEELSEDQIKKLKIANRKLSRGFFS